MGAQGGAARASGAGLTSRPDAGGGWTRLEIPTVASYARTGRPFFVRQQHRNGDGFTVFEVTRTASLFAFGSRHPAPIATARGVIHPPLIGGTVTKSADASGSIPMRGNRLLLGVGVEHDRTGVELDADNVNHRVAISHRLRRRVSSVRKRALLGPCR